MEDFIFLLFFSFFFWSETMDVKFFRRKGEKNFIILISLRKVYRGQFIDCYSMFFFSFLLCSGLLFFLNYWVKIDAERLIGNLCRFNEVADTSRLRLTFTVEIFWESFKLCLISSSLGRSQMEFEVEEFK